MQVRVLGCSGGIGGALRTTSLLLDRDILIDAGTGVGDLTIDEMIAIDHVFLTHSHLDHVAFIPLMMDTVLGMREKHVTVHATRETWHTLREHIFNWKIWPDFNVIPHEHAPVLRYSEIRIGETVQVGNHRITPLPVNHVVPSVAFQIDSGMASLVFSGDTTTCDALWTAINGIENLKYLIIETAFSNAEIRLAQMSGHLCPAMLIAELGKLCRPATIYITHLKPGEGEEIMRQIDEAASPHRPQPLLQGQVFEF